MPVNLTLTLAFLSFLLDLLSRELVDSPLPLDCFEPGYIGARNIFVLLLRKMIRAQIKIKKPYSFSSGSRRRIIQCQIIRFTIAHINLIHHYASVIENEQNLKKVSRFTNSSPSQAALNLADNLMRMRGSLFVSFNN
jgi:hypothetical protein